MKSASPQRPHDAGYPQVASEAPHVLANLEYDEIKRMSVELRARHPFLTPEQAFARVYQDPANRELVRRERQSAHDRFGYVPAHVKDSI
jgi:hypothetical protein